MKTFTHTGILVGCSLRRKGCKIETKLRETKLYWIDGMVKYKKSNGLTASDPWAILKLDLDTIKEIEE